MQNANCCGSSKKSLIRDLEEYINDERCDSRYYAIMAANAPTARAAKLLMEFSREEALHAQCFMDAYRMITGCPYCPKPVCDPCVPEFTEAVKARIIAETADYKKYGEQYLKACNSHLKNLFFMTRTDEAKHAMRMPILLSDAEGSCCPPRVPQPVLTAPLQPLPVQPMECHPAPEACPKPVEHCHHEHHKPQECRPKRQEKCHPMPQECRPMPHECHPMPHECHPMPHECHPMPHECHPMPHERHPMPERISPKRSAPRPRQSYPRPIADPCDLYPAQRPADPCDLSPMYRMPTNYPMPHYPRSME
ncbi:ferritin-like domain-containing protein [Heliophilum fasciatum]|uniref:Rubrerythrin n=1 Tax=Heliophilum fasciatum TaxID=35700 RepID=A0A4R2RYJ6_9FIRM|nr:ferritin-like domain-containing protein [Heliophilum fasciatum]MCW2278105.1 rubrerythrin [Heliophilum fasciatum]TCP64175.1 rubrerythrin [Heliophilum fasciatum]